MAVHSSTPNSNPKAGNKSAGASSAESLRATLLFEDSKPLIIWSPQSHIVDRQALERACEGELRIAGQPEIDALLAKHRCAGLSAVPIADVATLIESSLFEVDALQIVNGDVVETADTLELVRRSRGARLGTFSSPLPHHLSTNAAADLKEINDAVANFTTMRVSQRLEETLNLPPLPDAARRIIQLQLEPDYDLSDLTAIVETDAPLAAQVVGWANSPYYGAQGTVDSINDAIMRVLGFDVVINLALGLAVGKTLKVPELARPGLTPYWLQSVYTATTMEGLLRCMSHRGPMKPGLAYLAGLLNNFGFLVLAHIFPPQFEKILGMTELNRHLSIDQIDRFVLGASRHQIAAQLLDNWSLPSAVICAVRHQDDPTAAEGDHASYADLMHLCSKLLQQVHISTGPSAEPPTDADYERLGIDRDRAAETLQIIVDSADELGAIAQTIGQ